MQHDTDIHPSPGVRSQYGGSSVSKRRPTRQNTYPRSRGNSGFGGEEEEGYGSGEFDEGFELVRIKVKVRSIIRFCKKEYPGSDAMVAP
jgi:hypothetical protein